MMDPYNQVNPNDATYSGPKPLDPFASPFGQPKSFADIIELTEEEIADFTNYRELNRQLDITKSKVFTGRNAAFLAPLMSMLDFKWSFQIGTAGTDGKSFWWSPKDFLSIPQDQRNATIEHELWHVARLHMLRIGDRDPRTWNIACDVRINRDLRKQGYVLPDPLWIQNYDDIPFELEEEIYDQLIKQNPPLPSGNNGSVSGDSSPAHNHMIYDNLTKEDKQNIVNNVVTAMHQHNMTKNAGSLPGGIEMVVKKFLAPIVPWNVLLANFFTDLIQENYTWRKPRRSRPDMYLPSIDNEEGRLDHLIYYQDVSGSITDNDIIRFNSELKHVKERYNPRKLTIVQFDTQIKDELTLTESDNLNEIKILGRGGTSLACVHEHIMKHKPTAAVIFSDLYCSPMETLPQQIPIVWVVVNNPTASVPFGKVICIKS